MRIVINERALDFDRPLTLETLLATLNQLTSGVAIALNQQIIPASQWQHTPLNDGDNILIFQAIAGG